MFCVRINPFGDMRSFADCTTRFSNYARLHLLLPPPCRHPVLEIPFHLLLYQIPFVRRQLIRLLLHSLCSAKTNLYRFHSPQPMDNFTRTSGDESNSGSGCICAFRCGCGLCCSCGLGLGLGLGWGCCFGCWGVLVEYVL